MDKVRVVGEYFKVIRETSLDDGTVRIDVLPETWSTREEANGSAEYYKISDPYSSWAVMHFGILEKSS